jgi:hypothetical protein
MREGERRKRGLARRKRNGEKGCGKGKGEKKGERG